MLEKMRLHGTIPQFVEGDFPSLRIFSVSNNALHGTIPSSVGFLTGLSQLHMVRSISSARGCRWVSTACGE